MSDIEYNADAVIKHLKDELDNERRISRAMAETLHDMSEALGMDTNDPHTLAVVRAYVKKSEEATKWRDRAAGLSYTLGIVLGTVRNDLSDREKLIAINGFFNTAIKANLIIDSSDVVAFDETVNEFGEPELIYLQLHGDRYEQPADFKGDEITWCWHKINECDVKYVRADIARHFSIPNAIPSTFKLWWSMIEADGELAEKPLNDSDIVLSFMGNGGSCQVTAGDIRKMLK